MFESAAALVCVGGCESLDDIAKDHVTHSDRRADDSGQKKVQTANDR